MTMTTARPYVMWTRRGVEARPVTLRLYARNEAEAREQARELGYRGIDRVRACYRNGARP